MKTLTSTLAMLAMASSAFAADLGGNCCADLEERVAELEATAARKGTRKMSVEVYGIVSKQIMWFDAKNVKDGVVGDNSNSPTRFGFQGQSKIDGNWSAGYQLEIGAGDTGLSVRKAAWWIEQKDVGRFTLGRTSGATDGISEVSIANTNVANLPSTIYGVLVDGDRKDLVRYDTQTYGGLTGALSAAENGKLEAAARYAQQFGDFRFAAGLGYGEEWFAKRISGSASLMHVPSGLFANIVGGQFRPDGDHVLTAAHVTAGVEKKFNALGATTVYGEYGKLTYVDMLGSGWGIGAVQAIDAAAMDIYVTYRSIDVVGDAKHNLIMGGARVRF